MSNKTGADDEGQLSTDVLQTTIEESEKTLEYQLDTLADIDDKALRIYRANVLFLSIVIGVVSIAVNSEPTAISHLINLNSVTGVVLLLGSLSTGAITYRASNMEGGIGPDEIQRVLRDAQDEWKSSCLVLSRYKQYLSRNDEVLEENAKWMTYTTILTINALAYLALGVFVTGVVDETTSPVFAVVIATLGFPLVVWISKILSFDRSPGWKYILGSGLVVLPFVGTFAFVDAPMVTRGWLNVPLYFLLLSLVQNRLDVMSMRSYFLVLLAMSLLTIVLVLPASTLPVFSISGGTVVRALLPATACTTSHVDSSHRFLSVRRRRRSAVDD